MDLQAKMPALALASHDMQFSKKRVTQIFKSLAEITLSFLKKTALSVNVEELPSDKKAEKSQIFFKILKQDFISGIHLARLNNDIQDFEKDNQKLVALNAIALRINHQLNPITTEQQLSAMVDKHISSEDDFRKSTVLFSPCSQEPYSLQSTEEQAELALLQEWSRTAPKLTAGEYKEFTRSLERKEIQEAI
ncbi:hypothetical protein [Candidatus Regiella insecticola]|uniref:hypothetical protein n=1 Tax=Candidatus Regiella insecticola TaxID=138073 RepID=UPI00030AF172|nr:hypothetical protein [Candidatus Regiella insecticola]